MNLGLEGKTALVTGASAGLGFATALELAREGVHLAINSRSLQRLETASEHIRRETGHVSALLPADLSQAGAAEDVVLKTHERLGSLDILVVNAGGPPPGQFMSHTKSTWLDSADLTLFSAINLCRAAIPEMIRKRWGRVVFITSIAVKQPIDNLVMSNTLRAGVTGLSKSLSNELARHGITFNTVCPGYTETERLQNLVQIEADREGHSIDEVYQTYCKRVPAGRLGKPDELAALITFLASERASYITGTSLTVDGGLYKGLL